MRFHGGDARAFYPLRPLTLKDKMSHSVCVPSGWVKLQEWISLQNQEVGAITEPHVIERAELHRRKEPRDKIPNYRCLAPSIEEKEMRASPISPLDRSTIRIARLSKNDG